MHISTAPPSTSLCGDCRNVTRLQSFHFPFFFKKNHCQKVSYKAVLAFSLGVQSVFWHGRCSCQRKHCRIWNTSGCGRDVYSETGTVPDEDISVMSGSSATFFITDRTQRHIAGYLPMTVYGMKTERKSMDLREKESFPFHKHELDFWWICCPVGNTAGVTC